MPSTLTQTATVLAVGRKPSGESRVFQHFDRAACAATATKVDGIGLTPPGYFLSSLRDCRCMVLKALWNALVGWCVLTSWLRPPAAEAQLRAEFLRLNPQIRGRGADAAARWKLTDLSQSQGDPLAGDLSYGINVGDLDRDGDLDIAAVFQSGSDRLSKDGSQAGKVYWLENLSGPQGTIPRYRVHLIDDRQLTPKDVVVLESSDKACLVVPCYLARETILYQTSDGKHWNKVRLPSSRLQAPVRAVIADIDGNGTDDVVVTSISESGDAVAWFRHTPDKSSSWQAVSLGVKLPPLVGVDAGDVDGDGDVDVVCASEHSDRPYFLVNVDGTGTDWRKETLQPESAETVRHWVASFSGEPVSQNHVKLVDIDRDGDLDCLETSLKNGYAAWRERVGGSKHWRFHPIAGNLEGAYSFHTSDVDRDDRLDIVVPSGAAGVYLFRNLGDSLNWEATRLGHGNLKWANITRFADLDADGYVEILATDWGHRALVWRNPFGGQ